MELFFLVPLVGTDWAKPGEKIKAKVNTAAIIILFAIQNLLGLGIILKGTEAPELQSPGRNIRFFLTKSNHLGVEHFYLAV
ncbi:MAG: hypothetical protein ACOZF2_07820 [Thermodesulfobacteriota bacterium]